MLFPDKEINLNTFQTKCNPENNKIPNFNINNHKDSIKKDPYLAPEMIFRVIKKIKNIFY